MAAAPADFRAGRGQPTASSTRQGGLDLHLEPTEDILAAPRRHARGESQTIVGFAAEHGGEASSAPARKLSARAPT